MSPIKNGLEQRVALSPLLFNFALEYAIMMVQVNQNGMKLNGTHQLRLYAGDINILGESVQTVKKKHTSFSSCFEEDRIRSKC
jgi:hypothetical protein